VEKDSPVCLLTPGGQGKGGIAHVSTPNIQTFNLMNSLKTDKEKDL
jgi:hypothetical protein